MDSIIDGIAEAQDRLYKEQVRANCVVIDNKYIKLKKRLFGAYPNMHLVAPMIGGLRAFFDDLPDDTAFFVMEGHNFPETELDRLKTENRDLKEQLEQLRKIKEVLGMEVEA